MKSCLSVVLALVASLAAAQCSNPIVRQNWDDLSGSDKSAYLAALQALANRTQIHSTDPTQMSLKDFTNMHVSSSPYIHDSAEFYPYHRVFLWKLEQALASVGWAKGLVYWDWFKHNSDWSTTDVFSSSYFGSVSSGDQDNCVLDGFFKKGSYNVANLDIPQYRTFPNQGDACLRRCANPQYTMTSLYDGTLHDRLGALSYAEFRGDTVATDDANGYHMSGHEVLGGDPTQCDMASSASSPNDPIFYLHHGLVDKVWYLWQSRCGAFKKDYEGPYGTDPTSIPGNDHAVDSGQILTDWGIPVSQVLDTQGGTLCYTYSSSAMDSILATLPPINCPGGHPSTTAPPTNPPATSPPSTNPHITNPPTIPPPITNPHTTNSPTTRHPYPTTDSPTDSPTSGHPNPPTTNPPTDSTAYGPSNTATSSTAPTPNPQTFKPQTPPPSTTPGPTPQTYVPKTLPPNPYSYAPQPDTQPPFQVWWDDIVSDIESDLHKGSNGGGSSDLEKDWQKIKWEWPGTPFRRDNDRCSLSYNDTHIIVSHKLANFDAVIPADHTIRFVYNSYVESYGPDGRIYKYHMPTDLISYPSVPGAPQNVQNGHPCFQPYSTPITDHWIHSHQMNENRVRNGEAKARWNIDQYNVRYCFWYLDTDASEYVF